MTELTVSRYTPDLRASWDAIVRRSKNGDFLHCRDYIEYHAHRFDEASLLFWRDRKAIAVFPCNREGDKIVSHGGLTYAGLIYGSELHATDVLSLMQAAVRHFRDAGATTLIYKATPHIFHRYPAEEDLYALWRLGARLSRRDLSSAVLLPVRPRLSDSRKNTVRKAAKSGVTLEEPIEIGPFHELLTQVLAKFDARPVHSLEELRLLKHRFPQQIRLFCAMLERKLLAGSVVYDFDRTVHTQYLATSEAGRELGALDFLITNLIEQRYADRTYFSFGISTVQQGRQLNEGLMFQKEGFGARSIVHDFYEVDLRNTCTASAATDQIR
jgi:hypothetical protein